MAAPLVPFAVGSGSGFECCELALRSATGLLDWGGPIEFEGVTSMGSGLWLMVDEDDEERMGMDRWMPAERWSAAKGLRWMDSVADAIGPSFVDVKWSDLLDELLDRVATRW